MKNKTKQKIKVIFLDIDGVVNCKNTMQRHRGAIGIDPHIAFRIGKIILETDAKIVLSSSWKHYKDGINEVNKQVYKIHDVTPMVKGVRGNEIKAWLDKHPEVEKYAILDDDSDMLDEQMDNFFKTLWDEGITDEIMNKVINHLK